MKVNTNYFHLSLQYQCTQVMDAVGCVVLDVLQQEHLMASAASVGGFLKELLIKLQQKHEYIGGLWQYNVLVSVTTEH